MKFQGGIRFPIYNPTKHPCKVYMPDGKTLLRVEKRKSLSADKIETDIYSPSGVFLHTEITNLE